MNDEQLEQWVVDRSKKIKERLKKRHDETPEFFWDEINSLVTMLVIECGDADATDWPENLVLQDVLSKHLIRALCR